MGNIVLLDDLTINKIAAGEVVERPASVVKELVENSIDAGATNISVEIKNGGISYIRITDNGKGIASDDIEIAFERHATSKIRQADDLNTVKSMGFRGEALASVAAISNVELMSKQPDTDIGNRVVVEAGNVLEKEETGCPTGTTITVKNLFFNTPVRYKFLKKDYTEAGYIEDAITRLALINPNIAFKLVNSGKVIVQTYGNGNLNNVIYSIFGKDIASAVVDVDYEYEGVHVKGVVGKPEIARSNRTNQIFFVNKRYVKDKTLSGATEQAFKGLLPIGKYGFLVLNVEVNPAKVDVNVHPAKLEVRFEEESAVFKAVFHAIKDSLLKTELVENASKEPEEKGEMGLTVLEETGLFGKIFKNKKAKADWERLAKEDSKNRIADIYKSRSEGKRVKNKKGEQALKENEEEYNNAPKNEENKIEDLNLDINSNVFEKIAMLQKQVADDLENNPQLVFDRNKLEEEKKKLSQLRNFENIENEKEIETQEIIANTELNITEDINSNKTEQEQEVPVQSEPALEQEEIKEETTVNLEETNPNKEIENIEIQKEEKEENKIKKEQLENAEDKEEPVVANNQILQVMQDNVNNENISEEKNNKEDKNLNFDEMYAKIFGRTLNEARESKTEKDDYTANDIVTVEDDEYVDSKQAIKPYETIKNNNVSVFENDSKNTRANYKFIGVVFSTYIILEIKKDMYIIDQHAAHERIMYEKVKKNFYSEDEKDSQLLLLPDIITLSHKELDIVNDNWEIFEKAGFELEYFGDNTIKLVGVPEICFDLDTKALFLETLDEINTVARTAKQEIEEKFIATVACKAAVKANMNLSDEEVYALLDELMKLPNPFTCPHGRPTAIKMNKNDLEKKFSRRK